MDHLGINVDQFLWVPSIAEISPRFFEDNEPYQIYDILWHFGGPRYAIFGINLYYWCWCGSLQNHFILPSGGP